MHATTLLAPLLFLIALAAAAPSIPHPYANNNPYANPYLNVRARADGHHSHHHNGTYPASPPAGKAKRYSPSGNFSIPLTAFPSSDNCHGRSHPKSYLMGHCVDLPTPAESWFSAGGNAGLEMSIYSAPGCQGRGAVEHLDADGSCFTPASLGLDGKLASVCVGC